MLGRILLTIDAIGLIFGAPIADFNHTHIYNPRWPPHAKFHAAQTIALAVTLGLATLFFTWQSSLSSFRPRGPALAAQRDRDAIHIAVFTGSIYWLAGMAAILFPNTDGLDPEFGGPGFPQLPLFTGFMGAAIAGWLLEGST